MLEKIAWVSDDWAEVWNKSKDLIEKKKERKKEREMSFISLDLFPGI